MIIGIVIGSGIFFKADDVLLYTNGNILVGILIFIVAAIAIIFGSLAISQLATRTDKPGGIISYAEEFVNKETASAFGWFQVFLYASTTVAIVTWVAAIYICQLFGIDATLIQQILIGIVILIIIFALNILSAKLGGYFQNLAMIIKLIPLIAIAILGFIKGNPVEALSNDISNLKTTMAGAGVLAAFGPIAFAFDGWIISTTISNEIKDSKRNLPIALIISPIIVLICYVAYFIGISVLVGPEQVLELENESVNKAAEIVFGPTGAKIMLIFVVISVLGTCNGMILGIIRMPYSLGIRNMIPFSDKFSKESKKLNGMPLNSALLAFCVCLI
ncbi:MAG: APC family permease, partial [Eubacteriales bacterium]|nr:APC family permease [Eubacteriales bacterium]